MKAPYQTTTRPLYAVAQRDPETLTLTVCEQLPRLSDKEAISWMADDTTVATGIKHMPVQIKPDGAGGWALIRITWQSRLS